MPTTTRDDYIIFSPEEVQEWNKKNPANDEMPAWVCAIGGYEVLLDGNIEHATNWMIRFGMKPHEPIRGGPFLSREVHRLRGATHYGYLWWQGWGTRWPAAWQAMLDTEFWRRYRTGASRWWPKDRQRLEELNAFVAAMSPEDFAAIHGKLEP